MSGVGVLFWTEGLPIACRSWPGAIVLLGSVLSGGMDVRKETY